LECGDVTPLSFVFLSLGGQAFTKQKPKKQKKAALHRRTK
jgi:hypothetical protein